MRQVSAQPSEGPDSRKMSKLKPPSDRKIVPDSKPNKNRQPAKPKGSLLRSVHKFRGRYRLKDWPGRKPIGGWICKLSLRKNRQSSWLNRERQDSKVRLKPNDWLWSNWLGDHKPLLTWRPNAWLERKPSDAVVWRLNWLQNKPLENKPHVLRGWKPRPSHVKRRCAGLGFRPKSLPLGL